MASRVMEAEPFDQRNEFARVGVACRELDEFGAFDSRWRRERREVGDRRLASGGAFGRERFTRRPQRPHAVDRDRRGGGAAELVVEDFQR